MNDGFDLWRDEIDKLKEQVEDLQFQNEKLKAEAESVDELLDDIAAFRSAQIAVKAIIAEAVGLLTDTERTEADLDEAVRLLKQSLDYCKG